ncbi:MAG: hypothetical protein JWQ35_1169 [Bacteriovoracaceae bacterium]|nr:hypothetical protein [Bacteriovoracaceae bacterium]
MKGVFSYFKGLCFFCGILFSAFIPLRANDLFCLSSLTKLAGLGRPSAEETQKLLASFKWSEINWAELSVYFDPGKISRDHPFFPTREKILEIFKVDASKPEEVAFFRENLISLAALFSNSETVENISKDHLPEAFLQADGVELEIKKGVKMSRLEALEFFVSRRLLYLSKNPSSAVTLAFSDVEKRSGYRFDSRLLSAVKWLGRLPTRTRQMTQLLKEPVAAAQIPWNEFVYFVSRYLVNWNMNHSALSDEATQKFAFVLENAPLADKKDVLLPELTEKYRLEIVKNFTLAMTVAQIIDRKSGPIALPESAVTEDVVAALLERQNTKTFDARESAKNIFEESKVRLIAALKMDAIFLRNMISDLEEKYQTLDSLLNEDAKIGSKVRAELDQSALSWTERLNSEYKLFNVYKRSSNEKIKKAAEDYVRVYRPARTSQRFQYSRLPEKYHEIYETDARVKLAGSKVSRKAEADDKRDRNKRMSDFAEAAQNFAFSPTTILSLGNATLMTAQILGQIKGAGILNSKKSAWGSAILSLAIMTFVIEMNKTSVPVPSELKDMFSQLKILTEDTEFENKSYTFVQHAHGGINSADKKYLDDFFHDPGNASREAGWQRRFRNRQHTEGYLDPYVFFEREFPIISHHMNNRRIEELQPEVDAEYYELLKLIREAKIAERKNSFRILSRVVKSKTDDKTSTNAPSVVPKAAGKN